MTCVVYIQGKVLISDRGVNRNPKILDLRKCPKPIQTSVGHPIFTWTVFGTAINYNKFRAFFDPIGLGTECKSVSGIAMCIFLCTSVTVREHLACGEHF